MNQTDEGLNIEYIPANFKEGASVIGFIVKPSYILQAVPFVVVIVIMLLTVGRNWDFVVRLIIFLITCAPVVFVATVGIRGDSLFTFLKNFFLMKKSARPLLYDPSVKTESRRVSEYERGQSYEARDKIISFVSRFQKEDSDEEAFNISKDDNIVFVNDKKSLKQKKGGN